MTFTVDFQKYLRKRRGKSDPLARALRPFSPRLHVLDATAGFLEDSFLFAQLGHQVTAAEREPAIFELARTALEAQSAELPVLSQIRLVREDSRQILLREKFDVVYLDPFFPAQKNSALPKKKMQVLHDLGLAQHSEEENQELLKLALQSTLQGVIVKRRLKDPLLQKPRSQVFGTRVRYDVFRLRDFARNP